jgi:type IV pilus assembly protein PilM
MWRMFRPSKVVGLDLGAHEMKAVTISTGLKNIEVLRAIRIAVPKSYDDITGADLKGMLQTITAHDLFPSEWIVAGLNGNEVAVRSFNLPHFKGRTGDTLVKYEMESMLPYQADEMVVDYWIRPVESEDSSSVVAMAARKSIISQLLGRLGQIPVEPRMIGWSTLGAYTALNQIDKAIPGNSRCLLDIGARSTSLVIFNSSGLQMVRSIDFGGADLTEVLAAELHLSLEQAEALKIEQGLLPQSPTEVKRILIEQLTGLLQEIDLSRLSLKASLDQITVTGGSAKLPGIQDFLRERTGVECSFFNPFEHFTHNLSKDELSFGPEYAAALGLALSAISTEGARVDFRHGEFAFKRPLGATKGKLIACGAMALCILILLIADFSLVLRHKEERYRELKSDIRSIFKRTLPNVNSIVNEERQLAQAIDEAKNGLASVAFNREGGSLLGLLNRISQQIPADARIRVTELAVEENQDIVIVGEADSFESVDQLKERLNAFHDMGTASVEGANSNEFSKIIEFTIKIKKAK